MNRLLANTLALVFLANIMPAASASVRPSSTAADDSSDLAAGLSPDTHWNNRRIVGVWEEQVSQIDCQDGTVLRSFRAINTFASGGTLTAYNNTPPTLSTPALGTWSRVSWYGDFAAKMKFFRYNADGSFAGSQEVTRSIRVDSSGEGLTGDITFKVFDVNDVLVMSGCASETGQRFH